MNAEILEIRNNVIAFSDIIQSMEAEGKRPTKLSLNILYCNMVVLTILTCIMHNQFAWHAVFASIAVFVIGCLLSMEYAKCNAKIMDYKALLISGSSRSEFVELDFTNKDNLVAAEHFLETSMRYIGIIYGTKLLNLITLIAIMGILVFAII